MTSETASAGRDASAPPRRVTVAELRDWVKHAQPGARKIYGYGSNPSQCVGGELREYVMTLYEKGYLTPHHAKLGPDAPVQIVVRSQKPALQGTAL